MKTWFVQVPLLIFIAVYSCRKENSQEVVQVQSVQVVSDTTQILDFAQDIVPMLKAHCSPCHFPGGKMYKKMPFDQSKTIMDHKEGVVKRFKAEELEKIKAYLHQEAP